MDNVDLVDYSRQEALDLELDRGLSKDTSHIIIGCGGVGFWLGIMLAMGGHTNFMIIDGEVIDYSNLNRLPVPQTWVGINKAIALRKIIRSMRPITRVSVIQRHIDEDSLDLIGKFHKRTHEYNTMVWDTTDNAIIQRKINAFVVSIKNNSHYTKVNYRKIGYEAWNVGCYENYDVWIDEENYERGYRTSNANAITSAISAGLGIFAKGLNVRHDVSLNLSNILTQPHVGNPEEVRDLKALLRECKVVMQDAIENENFVIRYGRSMELIEAINTKLGGQ